MHIYVYIYVDFYTHIHIRTYIYIHTYLEVGCSIIYFHSTPSIQLQMYIGLTSHFVDLINIRLGRFISNVYIYIHIRIHIGKAP